ncbi:MAG: LON peptidase substrate-binding domain-containing protein [bacterium]|nr:LON peptidase substrate-binding domain-containing protein [bacterium]
MVEDQPVQWLPMFPLGRGIFPGSSVTLRVFEPRYRQMMDGCLNRQIGFGVVLIERGSEVGGGDVRFDVGVSVTIEQVWSLGNGHLMVAARGCTRFRVEKWIEDDPFPQAVVRYIPDPERYVADPGLRDPLERAFSRGLAMMSELGLGTGAIAPLPADPLAAAYRALELFPVPDLDRQRILEDDDPGERIIHATAALESVNQLVEARLGGG